MVTAHPIASGGTDIPVCARTAGLRARDNPFRVERVHGFRYRPLGISWDAMMEKLSGMRMRGAIVGPEGSGKTTLLEDLEQRLKVAGHATRWLQKSAGRPKSPGLRRESARIRPLQGAELAFLR